MAVRLRATFELSDDSEVVIHMGAGARRDIVRAAVRNYHEYATVARSDGAFTVSVFAAINGVAESDILASLPQGQYGTSTYGALRDRFEMWPTTIEGTGIPARVMAVHFDIVLPDGGFRLPAGSRIEDLSDEQLGRLDELLAPAVESLIPLFEPRRRKLQ